MDLSNLSPAEGSEMSDNFRRGRGHGSGNGKTAGKGHKGQKARSGAPRPLLKLSLNTEPSAGLKLDKSIIAPPYL